jgi:Na+-translocating ferredoxin:NAD+ oxidoreductase RnfC subunit
MYKPLEEDLKIQFEIITLGYNSENYTPIQTAKLMFPEVEIFKRIELIEKYKKINNVLWSIEKTSVMRDGTIMIIRPTLRNANQPLYIHSTNWTIHNGYPATNENLITNETERAYILDRLLQYKKHCQSEYNQIKTIIQNLKID